MKKSQYKRGMTRRERKAERDRDKLRFYLHPRCPGRPIDSLYPSVHAPENSGSGPVHWMTMDEARELYE